MKPHLRLLSLFSALGPSASALTWSFTSYPTQCGDLTAKWSGGTAPFTLLLVPTGHIIPETRTIVQEDVFTSSVTLRLNYPANSTFIAVLSDASGVGAGGTSVVTAVADSSNTSCLNTQEVSPEFYLYLPDSIDQCDSVEITWGSDAESPVDILGLVPGGQSFEIANITDSSTTSHDWTADVRSGTSIVFVAGDKNGLGKGGSSDVMSIGSSSNYDCLDSNSPSPATGTPAGGVSSTARASATSTRPTATQSGQITTTDNTGNTVTMNQPPTLTTTNGADTVTVTAGQASFTTTDSVGHTTTFPGIPLTTTDNAGSTVTAGGSSFPGSGGGTVTGSSRPSSDDSSGSHLPLILGLVFGFLALLGMFIGAYILYRRRKAHEYQYLEKGIDRDAPPWFARGAHLRGGAYSSISTLPEMYQTEPFILPSKPQSYYSYSPVPTPRLSYCDPHLQEHAFALTLPQLASRMNSNRSTRSFSDNAPLAAPAVGYGTLGHPSMHSHTQTSTDSKDGSAASIGPHGRPVSRTPSSGMPPVSSPDPPTRVARDSEDVSPEAKEALLNPLEEPFIDIPPTYASARRASWRRSLDQSNKHATPWGARSPTGQSERPERTLHRSNAHRRNVRSEMQSATSQQESHDHGHEGEISR